MKHRVGFAIVIAAVATATVALAAPAAKVAPKKAELELLSVVPVSFESGIETHLKLERDRCYVIVLRTKEHATLDYSTVVSGMTAEVRAHNFSFTPLPVNPQGGSTRKICPLETGPARLRLYRAMFDASLGKGDGEIEIWSRKATAQELKVEADRQRAETKAALEGKPAPLAPKEPPAEKAEKVEKADRVAERPAPATKPTKAAPAEPSGDEQAAAADASRSKQLAARAATCNANCDKQKKACFQKTPEANACYKRFEDCSDACRTH